MHGNADGAGLVCNGAGDGLANPPGGIGGEFVAAAVFKFFHRFHQAHVAFLNQIQEGEAAVGIFFGNGNDQAQIGLHHFILGPAGFAKPFAEFLVGFSHLIRSHPHAKLQLCQMFLEFLVVRFQGNLLLHAEHAVAGLVNHGTEILNHLVLEIQATKELHQNAGNFVEFGLAGLDGLGRLLAAVQLAEGTGCVLMGLLYLGAELGQPFHIALTGVYLFVKDNAVKAFLIVEQAIGYVQIGIRNETEAVHTALDVLFCVLNSLGNGHFLFTGKQGNLAHLFQVHADGIIQNVHLGFELFLFVLFFRADAGAVRVAVHIGRINDVKRHAAQTVHDGLVILLIDNVVGKGVINIVKSQIPLLLGELDKFTDFFLNFRSVNRIRDLAAGSPLAFLFQYFA